MAGLLRRFVPLLILLALVPAGGCASVRVTRTRGAGLLDAWRESVLTTQDLSPRTTQTLRQFDLTDVYHDRPAEASARLHAEALREPSPDVLFALCEINYQRGRSAEKRGRGDALACYYLSAGYAYHFLFDRPPGGDAAGPSAFDPRHRLACDLYNSSLAKCLAAAQRVGQFDPTRTLHIPAPDGRDYTLSVAHVGFAWRPEEFGPLRFSADYEVEGLANHHRTYGLGVPLVATRAPSLPRPAHAYYPPGVSFPVTAFLRYEGGLAELGEHRAGRFELLNPLTTQTVQVAGRPVPLETDLTTPLALFLAQAKLSDTGYKAFLNPDVLGDKAGIHTLEPYQPGKIPVVFVHGLFGSPVTWAPVYNDLLADPELRKRFQFWAYFYPTGNPYLATAADLRRGLARLRTDLDPNGKDRALDEMVFVGHSMGGLVSKLVTVEGGDDFWHLVSPAPLPTLKVEPQTRGELQSVFYFEPVTSVRRVIFLGTPHRGSRLSPSLVGRVGARLAGLPRGLLASVQDVVEDNPTADLGKGSARHHALPTSVDLLAPGSPALELLAARPRPQPVRYHSVIGVASPSTLPVERWLSGKSCEPGDGVVPYTSAHIDDADSELVVPADHYTVHQHPLAILEIRRILGLHAREVDGRLNPKPASLVVPVKAEAIPDRRP